MEGIGDIVTRKSLITYAKVVCGSDLYKDVLQEVFLILHSMPDKVNELNENGELERYCKIIIFNLIHSEKSSMFSDEKKLGAKCALPIFLTDDYFEAYNYDIALQAINSVEDEQLKDGKFPIDVLLLKQVIKEGSIRKVSEQTQIPIPSIHQYLRRAKKKIIKRYYEFVD